MNSLPLISVRKPPRIWRRIQVGIRRSAKKLSPLWNSLLFWFRRMWRKPKQRKIFLGVLGTVFVFFALFLTARFWPVSDNQFSTNPLRPGVVSAHLPDVEMRVEARTTGQPGFSVSRNGSRFAFQIPGNAKVLSQKDGSSLTFRNQENQEVHYFLQNNGIKEEIKLFDKPITNTFSTQIRVNNVVAKHTPNGALYFYDKNDQYQFHIEAPFAQDATGNTTWGVSYRLLDEDGNDVLTPQGEKVQRELLTPQETDIGRNYQLQVVVNEDWLFSRERQYPLLIDPTIIHDTTSEFSSGYFERARDSGSGSNPRVGIGAQEATADSHTIGLWHLEDSGTSMTDSSGRGFTGTASNTTLVTGKFGNGREFNGSTSYISVADNRAFSLLGANAQLTLSAWINPDTISTGSRTWFITKGTTSNYEWGFGLNNSGYLYCEQWTLSGSSVAYTTTTYTPKTGEWQHIACTIRSGTEIQIYADGVLLPGTATIVGGTTGDGSAAVNFGRRGDSADNEFDGKMDDIRIDGIARSPEEIAAMAKVRPSATYTSPSLDLGSVTGYVDLSWDEKGVSTGDGETLSDTTNLVAQWNFNNTSGTTLTNNAGSCGSTCNGTLSNFASTGSQDAAALTGWTGTYHRWGAGALMFDGSNDYVSVPDNSALDFGTGNFTVSAWVRTTTVGNQRFIYKYNTDTTRGFSLQTTAGDPAARFLLFGTGGVAQAYAIGKTPINDGLWHHIVGVRDGTNTYLYVDGKLEATATGATADVSGNSNLFLGSDVTPANFFKGTIDAASVYSRALSAEEIAANAQAGNIEFQTRSSADGSTWEDWKPTTGETSITPLDSDATNWSWDNTATYAPVSKSNDTTIKMEGTSSLKLQTGTGYIDAGTYAYWKLNETSGSSMYLQDSTANNRDLAPTNGPTVTQGISGKARHFDGTNDYLVGNYGITGSSTAIDLWFRTTSTSYSVLLGQSSSIPTGAPSSYVPAITMLANGTIRGELYTGSIGAITSSKSYNDGKWHHVVLAGTSGIQALFIDGETIGTRGGTISQSWWTYTTIGTGYGTTTRSAPSNAWHYFNGDIDEVRISSTVLGTDAGYEAYRLSENHTLQRTISSTDLSGKTSLPFYVAGDRPGTYLEMMVGNSSFSNYRTDASTVGLWELDEQYGSGNYAKDGSGNGNHGTASGGPSSTQGVRGRAFSFDGTNDYLSTSNLTGLSTGNTAHSIEAWIKPRNTPGTRQWPLLLGGASNSNHHWTWNSTNTLQAGVWGSTGSQCTITLPVGSWSYVATTFDGTTLRCYLNGQLVQSVSATFNLTGVSLKLAQAQASEAYFAGEMDQVRISSGARSAGAIRQTYEISQRTHPITIEFGASLDSGNLIANSSDTSFTIDARTRGLPQMGSRISPGEKIIVRENVNGTEYIAQATIHTVNASTGAITTAAWDSGSTFPSGGYTVNADVFKWQLEYWNIDKVMDNQVSGVQSITLRITNGDEGRTVWLDALRSSSGYMSNPGGSTISSSPEQYFQYRAILTGNSFASSQIAAVSLQYNQYSVSDDAVFTDSSLHDKVKTKDTTPTIAFVASQADDFDLVYEVEWDDDADFASASSASSDSDPGFVNTDDGGDTSPFTASETVSYTWQSALTNGNTYFYRVRAKDVISDIWGNWSETRSLTIDTSLINDAWFETHADQFSTDDLEPNIVLDDSGNYAYIDPTGSPAFSKPITVTNSGSGLTNHHTLLTIDTASLISASKMQNDCDDLRFYDQNNAELTYWIESGCNTSTTYVWVLVPDLPTGDTELTMYYGNLLAPAGGESYTANMIAGFDGTCPVGWSGISAINSNNYFIRGGTAAVGTTGGSTTHTHTASFTTGTPTLTENAKDRDYVYNVSPANHTHSWSGSSGSANNLPPYYDLVFCSYSGIPTSLGTSFVGQFSSTPTGWTRFSALDDRFPRGNTTAGGTGGSTTHSHTISGTLTGSASVQAGGDDTNADTSSPSHTHTFTVNTNSSSSLPAYFTTVYAKPDSSTALVDGQIAMLSSNATPPLGWTRVTNLDDKFAYGSATYATTGGSDTHNHVVPGFTTANASGNRDSDDYTTAYAHRNHAHNVTSFNTGSSSTLPPYYTVSFYERKTDTTTKVVGSEISALRRTMISTPIEAEKITSARWNTLTFNDLETYGSITYKIFYDDNGTPTQVPNGDLPGNSTGFGTSPVDLSRLTVEQYPILYIVADIFYSNGSPELYDWQISFNEPPETPTLLAPANTSVLNNLTPTLQFTTTDFESDYLRYKIEICTNSNMDMGVGCQTFDQTIDQTNFSGQDAETGTAYSSGTTASYTFSSQLPINTTYYWRVYAIDPGGSDWWSGTQSPVWSFTTPNLVRPQMCLLEESRVDDSIIIRWDDPNIVETGYEIERDVSDSGFSAFDITAANVVSTTDTNVSPDNSYQYRIRAILGSSYTDWCTTPLLDIETGNFQWEGVQGEGLLVD